VQAIIDDIVSFLSNQIMDRKRLPVSEMFQFFGGDK
jgi:hypothetical protein